MSRRRGFSRPAAISDYQPTATELADAAALLAVLKPLSSERRMNALALAIRVWLDGHLEEERRGC